jgi:hypothetical protein
VLFKLKVGSTARAYCLAHNRDDAVEACRTKVKSGKLTKIERITYLSQGHNHELIAELAVTGDVRVEVLV